MVHKSLLFVLRLRVRRLCSATTGGTQNGDRVLIQNSVTILDNTVPGRAIPLSLNVAHEAPPC